MEVVVAFLEADVNRPVVVGCLFNGNNKPVHFLRAIMWCSSTNPICILYSA